MKKYKVRYSTSESTTKIDADSPTEAYKLFLKQTSVKPVPVVIHGLFSSEFFEDHIEAAKQRIHEKGKAEGDQRESQKTKEFEQNENLSTDELLSKIILMQKQQSELFENQIKNQNQQTEALNKIRLAIIGLGFFIIGTTIMLKMKWGL